MNLFGNLRHKQRIGLVFERTDELPYEAEQLRSDLARYLCVLVAGFIEQSLHTLYVEYAKDAASPKIARFLERQLRGSSNFNMERILVMITAFDGAWADEVRVHSDYDRFKAAVDTIYANSNLIAHGEDVGVSYVLVKEYYTTITRLLDLLVVQCER